MKCSINNRQCPGYTGDCRCVSPENCLYQVAEAEVMTDYVWGYTKALDKVAAALTELAEGAKGPEVVTCTSDRALQIKKDGEKEAYKKALAAVEQLRKE